MTLQIPQEIYSNPRECGEFIFSINERLTKLTEIEKELKEAKEIASKAMLEMLAVSGQKNFNFENLGIFKKTTSTKLAFPTAENGGKETAVQWLTLCLERGVISPAQLLDVQQARLVNDPVIAIEEAVEAYNKQQQLQGNTDLIPPSPFHRYEQVTLSTPRTRK